MYLNRKICTKKKMHTYMHKVLNAKCMKKKNFKNDQKTLKKVSWNFLSEIKRWWDKVNFEAKNKIEMNVGVVLKIGIMCYVLYGQKWK